MKLADLGDALLITPLIVALRQRYPHAQITPIVHPVGAAVMQHVPSADDCLVVADDGPVSFGHLLRDVKRHRFDALIFAHHFTLRAGALKYGALARVSGAPVRVGLDNGRGTFLTHRAIDHGFGHCPEWRYWLHLGELLGAPGDAAPQFIVPDAAREAADRLLGDRPTGPLVALHPVVGAYGPGRAWPVARFATVAQRLTRDHGATIILVGGADAVHAAASIRQRVPEARDLTGRTDLATLAALLQRADLLIGADSGVAHLSAVLDRPTLALFGPSNHRAWAPIGAVEAAPGSATIGRITVLRTALACAPCFYIGHRLGRPGGCATRSCLATLTACSVGDTAHRILLAAMARATE